MSRRIFIYGLHRNYFRLVAGNIPQAVNAKSAKLAPWSMGCYWSLLHVAQKQSTAEADNVSYICAYCLMVTDGSCPMWWQVSNAVHVPRNTFWTRTENGKNQKMSSSWRLPQNRYMANSPHKLYSTKEWPTSLSAYMYIGVHLWKN